VFWVSSWFPEGFNGGGWAFPGFVGVFNRGWISWGKLHLMVTVDSFELHVGRGAGRWVIWRRMCRRFHRLAVV